MTLRKVGNDYWLDIRKSSNSGMCDKIRLYFINKILCDIIATVLFCRLERAPTNMVPTIPLLLTPAGTESKKEILIKNKKWYYPGGPKE